MNSTIYFVSPPSDVFKILGNELTAAKRYCLAYLLESIWFSEEDFDTGAFMEVLEGDHTTKTKEELKEAILSGEIEWMEIPEKFSDQKRNVLILDVACNSAMKGCIQDQLLARIVGQHWSHAYVEKEDFSWLFDLLTESVDEGFIDDKAFGLDTGWSSLVGGLQGLEEVLVLAPYTGFPSEGFCPLNRGEVFSGVEVSERWKRSLEKLRADPTKHRWSPDTFGSHSFGDGLTGKQVMDSITE